ncbi:MAG: DNA polymerase III subunit delta [Opitutaceae bacterium]
MASRGPQRFVFVCGPDDYLVGRVGRDRFEQVAAGMDEFSCETISGFTANVGEVEAVVKQFREAVQTLGLFGGRRAVWLKDVNFLADSVTGRAEGTLKMVGDLQELLEKIDPAEVAVVITASPVDRRRSFPKWCEANSDFELAGESGGRGGSSINWRALADEECGRFGVALTDSALELLVAKTAGNARLFIGEIQKLATWLDEPGGRIAEEHVEELVPAFGEGDFFEAAEAFFSRNLPWTLDALRRHFFAGHDARPVITSLQNRNRVLIQLRALAFGGEVPLGARGVDKGALDRAARSYAGLYGDAAAEKTPFNVFSQNAWYLGKLAGDPKKLPPLRMLIDHQFEIARAFEELISRPNEQEEVLRAMAIRCLV